LGRALRFERRFGVSLRYRYLNPARLPISPQAHIRLGCRFASPHLL
jgi:hypothetical protein